MREIELYVRVAEAIELGQWISSDDMKFCFEMAKRYGCKPLEADSYNFCCFLTTLYSYGKIQGKRAERARRKGKSGATNYLFYNFVLAAVDLIGKLQAMPPERQQEWKKDCMEYAKSLEPSESERFYKILAVIDKYLKKE